MGDDILDKLAEEGRRMLERPLCAKCQLARVDPPAKVCSWCGKKAAKKKEKFERFMANLREKGLKE